MVPKEAVQAQYKYYLASSWEIASRKRAAFSPRSMMVWVSSLTMVL